MGRAPPALSERSLSIFGVDFDPDERADAVAKKLNNLSSPAPGFRDPYEGLLAHLPNALKGFAIGRVPVDDWLRSRPRSAEMVSIENYAIFIDVDGCRDYASLVSRFVERLPEGSLPLMIGVDHSSTGGALMALCKRFGKDEVLVLVLDSHLDAVPTSVRFGLIHYDLENNPKTRFKKGDPFIWDRPDSYNADSFLYYLIDEGVIEPRNLVVAGVRDSPPDSAKDIEDKRVQRFLELRDGLARRGVRIVAGEDLRSGLGELEAALMDSDAQFLYVSFDADVGSNSALRGSRFADTVGLGEGEIYAIAKLIGKAIREGGLRLVGLDVMETDVYKAGLEGPHGISDKTYEIEVNFLSMILDA
jgi:arginase family enzyme